MSLTAEQILAADDMGLKIVSESLYQMAKLAGKPEKA